MEENELHKASLTKAMALCASREYCVSEIYDKLVSWGLGNAEAFKITDRLKKDNFINEERYAASFVRDKFRYNRWGKVKIAAHLKAKRIAADLVMQALDSIDPSDYRQMMADLLKNHRKSVKAKNQYELKGKLMRFGLSRGFESSLLYELLGDLEDI
jgi:regulatory protein